MSSKITVTIGTIEVGGGSPVVVQSMTNTSTADTDGSVEQILRLEAAGCPIVRLTAQGRAEGDNLQNIVEELRRRGSSVAVVADIHFTPEVAMIAARYVDKVRINPGNFSLSNSNLERLIELCRERGVALRIGVNHGSLGERIVEQWGDTPEGMVAAAMEFLRICVAEEFTQVVVSMKSSNTRVMVYAYRKLVEAMEAEAMSFPIHLGVTEAGNGVEGRIKSAVGIGALLADGIGDTIRVSLTEDPVNEIPVAQMIVSHFEQQREQSRNQKESFDAPHPMEYKRRSNISTPIIHSELTPDFTIVESSSCSPTQELRAAIAELDKEQAVVVRRRYTDSDVVAVAVAAACDMGSLLLDGLADGIWVDAPNISNEEVEHIELTILQAARVRQSQTEYIACPSCGRTLFDIEGALAKIKARTSHLKHLKIGVMGCIVNGPGEMADADYGYVGAARSKITLYKGRSVVERNIDQEEAIDHLIELIKREGDWVEPQDQSATI
ncbi:MAG: (E)-4-hydroxy-3-methylbut-2-enyl-diphosphate synthase [Rikenellaceae bacterium]